MTHPSQTVMLLAALVFAAGCGGSGGKVVQSTEKFPEKTGFVQREITVDGQTKSVWVFVPPGYQPTKMYPAILFLHGLFEKGSANGGTNVLSAGLGPVIARSPDAWPFITIFPQSNGSWQGPEREQLAMAAPDDALRTYAIDPDRVVLAGLSYGGLGVWEIGARHKDRFAALVPVSGHAAPDLVEGLVTLPAWAFASADDQWVASTNSADMCRALQSRGGRVRLTEFAGDGHDCWTQAVDESEVVAWMLSQRRNPLQTSVAQGGKGSRSQASGRLKSWNEP